MKILLQFPEGLKQYALEHAKTLEAEGHNVIISCAPTYGACDIATQEATAAGADKIIHFGHAEFAPKVQKLDYPVEYIEYSIKADLSVLETSLGMLKEFKTIALVTTVQHIQQLTEIKDFYEKQGKTVLVGKPNAFAKYDGQMLGCDAGCATSVENNAECILYFGGGRFHPIGALMETKKPFIIVDPFSNKVEDISSMREVYKKKSRGKILSAVEAKRFGIIVSTKNGQMRMQAAAAIENAIKREGLDAYILTTNNIDFDSLNNMLEFDAFINTACPRISEDNERIRKPLLNPNELYEVLKLKKELEK